MDNALLRADCANCAALCCVALSFDKSGQFGFDKPAGTPCPHLDPDNRCAIHAQRRENGFAGCIDYDCFGAGQRVTQEVFAGRTIVDDPATLRSMMHAFRAMRQVHELLLLLRTADAMPISSNQRRTILLLTERLSPQEGWTVDSLSAFERGSLPDTVRAFLGSLSGVAKRAG
ncbi:hypothetical protein [Nitratireductor sp. XY-223]|uniref:hypothetical protein n=1 Tax=Nitratireductor sp. XY-223 TaxID=2561926 RepID=UPI0010AA637E|nr:hypothetical protein [Nitratireductor sp. XY-223]